MRENEIERPEPGSEYTEIVAWGAVVPGVPVPVVGTTVTGDDVEKWTGCLVVPVEEKEQIDE